MAKTATDTSIAPNTYAVGLGIIHTGVRTVIEYMNYVLGEMTTTYFCHASVRQFGAGPSFVETAFLATSTPYTAYEGEIWIDPDVQEITVIAECTTVGGNSVEIDVVIGSDTLNLNNFTGAATIEDSGQLQTATSGTGWRSYSVTLTHTVGSSPSCFLNRIYCGARRVLAADLPDPP